MNFGIGLLLGIIATAAISVPISYYAFSPKQPDPGQMFLALSLIPPTEQPPTINLIINGTAVPTPFNLTLNDFINNSYFSRYVLIQEKRWTGSQPLKNYTEFWVGIPLTYLIYDIANVTSYSQVTVNGSGNYGKAFNKTYIDNASYFDDLMVAYKKDGHYLGDPEGPIRFIATLEFTNEVFNWQVSGAYCVRQVIFIEIRA